jgi:hypothetical protein
MNGSDSTLHLQHEDFLKALVDQADLTENQQGHLIQCPTCQNALERIRRRFDAMGKRAARLTPSSSRGFRVPESVSNGARRGFRPIWAVGLTAAALLLFSLYGRQISFVPEDVDLAADRQLMLDVDALVANALPAPYRRVTSVLEPQIDEDLINWIVPSIEEPEGVL